MDKIIAAGSTATGKTVDAGGLQLTQRASIDLDIFGMRSEPYREHDVKANHAFRRGELTTQAADKILADLPKILTK